MRGRLAISGRKSVWILGILAALGAPAGALEPAPTGHPVFASPHAGPVALSPDGTELYVVNTPGDTLDVIDTATRTVTSRIPVGLDPVSVAVRPDGAEVWVSNHVSDTVSVIDVVAASETRHQVLATVTAWKEGDGFVTDFDEPSGIAFASNEKAYVALSSVNRIAVVDVGTRTVTSQFQVLAQEPRAISVRGGRLYVAAFEGMNQTEISGCFTGAGLSPGCTFDIFDLQSNSIDVILTRNMVADIIRNPETPDRDLFVYDTLDESLLHEVSGLGTLLYGLTVDSAGRVFVALTEARNDANGLTGTAGHDLAELENRAFLNQVVRVDCSAGCAKEFIDLEPLPPVPPTPGMQLATPFGIAVSEDDSTLVSVAASSSRLFTLDADSGAILGIVDVGAIPRGVALESAPDGSPAVAWVFNAIGNSVSVVDVSDPTAPSELQRIALEDPTHPDVKTGRIAFNDASGSTTGTFSCGSCHPDAHTDQLLWNLGARCVTPGCDQAQPRSTMPIRGLRDTLPLHWDGVVGDPFGGINAEVNDSGIDVAPTCFDEHGCFRELVNGSLATTMCDQAGCPADANEQALAGAFDEETRDALAVFLRAVPYPPARERRIDDTLSPLAATGLRYFVIGTDDGHPGCSRAGGCHSMPFWTGTNTPSQGFDAPTFRGIPDRHLLLPNGRSNMWGLVQLDLVSDSGWDPDHGPDELHSWGLTFGSEGVPLVNRNSLGAGPFELFQLFLEGSMGSSGAVGRQVTLDAETAADEETLAVLARLEEADADGVVNLHADGTRDDNGVWRPLRLAYVDGAYEAREAPDLSFTREELIALAAGGDAILTVTGRFGPNTEVDTPQPALWLPSPSRPTFLAQMPTFDLDPSWAMFGRHLLDDPILLVDGRPVDGAVSCESGGTFPECEEEALRVELASLPSGVGDHTFQLANRGGLVSNELLLVREACPEESTLEAAECRLGTLRNDFEASAQPGKLLEKLEKTLGKAEAKITQVAEKLAQGKKGGAKRGLRSVARQLKKFSKQVKSKLAQGELAEDVQVSLSADASALREEVRTLKSSL